MPTVDNLSETALSIPQSSITQVMQNPEFKHGATKHVSLHADMLKSPFNSTINTKYHQISSNNKPMQTYSPEETK